MPLYTVARAVEPDFEDWNAWTFSDQTKLRIDRATNTLRLKKARTGPPGPDGRQAEEFPTTADLSARSPTINPLALRAWRGIDADFKEPKDSAGVAATTVRFRLYDGTAETWWDGAAWDNAPVAGEWNTLADIQDNFGTFPITDRKIAVIVNLKTTVADVTPYLSRMLLLYDVDVPSYGEEFLYRTFLSKLGAIRPEADIVVKWAGGLTLDFVALDLEEPPGAESSHVVVAAYNHDDDAEHRTDILAGYAAPTVTLTLDPGAGKNVLLRVKYAPLVAVITHPDYDEISGLPAVLVQSIDERLLTEDTRREWVVKRTDGSALSIPGPRQVAWALSLRLVASRASDLLRLSETVEAFLRSTPVLSSPALDERADLVVLEPFSSTPRPDTAHVHDGTLTVELRSCSKWLSAATAGDGVKALKLEGDLAQTVS